MTLQAWLATSMKRFYPGSPAESRSRLLLEAARGERVAFQAAFRSSRDNGPLWGVPPCDVTALVKAPKGLKTRLRQVGYVPQPHLNTRMPLSDMDGVGHVPGLVPDPLYESDRTRAGANETHAFWVDVFVPKDAKPGSHKVEVILKPEGGKPLSLRLDLVVHRGVVQPRRDFPMTHWFYADVLIDWYKLKGYEPRFWEVLKPFLRNYVEHGQDTLYVPMLVPPLDGVRGPYQLLGVKKKGSRYVFDWTLVDRWVKEALAAGVKNLEWVHLFTQWGVEHALRVYEGHGETEKLLWPVKTGATSATYRDFLGQLLPELKRFLEKRNLLKRSFFHISDEPHGKHVENYRAARKMVAELAPWMKVMDALSDVEFAKLGLVDMPIPATDHMDPFLKAGIECWTYHCCGQRGMYLNRFFDTPLTKIRMHGWVLYKTKVKGFLHWGYNSWFKSQTRELIDPFKVSDGAGWPGWCYGDTFEVYPGEAGPIDSLRWESFAEGMRDYALLQSAGISPDDPLLKEVKDYARFPRSEKWILERRSQVLKILDRK